ncbi:GxxExxY protein [Novipirellula sp. SH528]|uniref:GxxExxY protein n=1 Tax=Novipirellula sp. SH528 TaxID=3454466 RepID=UPI003F9FCADC
MPVSCSISIGKLTTDELRDLDYRVMQHAFNSQNKLGRLADERIYQADLAARLRSAGIMVSREVELQLVHREYRKTLLLDLIVAEHAVYELKVVKAITDAHIGQLLTYLHLLDLPRGKLINFRSVNVESQFVNAPLDSEQRRSFKVNDVEFDGDNRFRDIVVSLLRDWGTSLTLSLYQEAVVSRLGGVEVVEAMLPVNRNGDFLGRQRYHLAAPNTAFKITAMNRDTSAYRTQLARLIHFSPLRAIHWINIAHHQVTFTTIPGHR